MLTSVGALGSTAAAAPARAIASEVSARVLVEFAPDASAEMRAAAVSAVGGYVDQEIRSLGVVRVAVPADGGDGYGAPAIAAALLSQPGVLSAEPDEEVSLEYTPDDDYFSRDPYVGLGQWGIRKAQVDKAWDEIRASPITVAVIDSGVDPTHPDLQGVLLPGKTYLSAPKPGCSGSATRDDNSHGTHVTGIIAANADNGVGIAGVAFGVKILPLKTLDCEGHGLLSDVAEAISDALDAGAKIISISLGSRSDSRTLRGAIELAASKNVLVVSAAGNCGGSPLSEKCDSLDQVSYPGAYPSVIAVAATEPDDTRSSFSTRASYVDIAAPGRRIVSTTPTYKTTVDTRSYAAFSGTSQATPFVAAVAALIWSREPSLTAAQVRARLIDTAEDLGADGRDDSFGAGRVNAYRAVTVAPAAPPPPPPTTTKDTYGATYGLTGVPVTAKEGEKLGASVRVTNRSSFTWSAKGTSAVKLMTTWHDDRGRRVGDVLETPFASNVAPGASATVKLSVTVPQRTGALKLRFDLIREGFPFSARGVKTGEVTVTIGAGALSARPALAAAYTVDAPPAVLPGGRLVVPVSVRNDGSLTWSESSAQPVRLAAHVSDPAGNTISWDGARTIFAHDVAPGDTVTTSVLVDAPRAAGGYVVRVDLVREGVAWFSSSGVAPGQTTLAVIDDLRATLPSGPLTVSRASPAVLISVTNASAAVWTTGGAVPVSLSSHWLDANGRVLVWDGPRARLPHALAPGETAIVAVSLGAIPAGGSQVVIDVVADGLRWGGQGAPRQVTLVQ